MADNLLEIRQLFVKRSGRYDLASTAVTELDTDAGADWFINQGMRLMEKMLGFQLKESKTFIPITSGLYTLTYANAKTYLQNFRAIKEVWINDDEGKSRLSKIDLVSLKDYYSDVIGDIDTAQPEYYSPISVRIEDDTYINSPGEFLNFGVSADDDNPTGLLTTLVWMPPADGTYTLEVIGSVDVAKLSVNTDANVFTARFPAALLLSALYQLEVFYRNTEGSKDWMNALQVELTNIEMDSIEEEIAELEEMEG